MMIPRKFVSPVTWVLLIALALCCQSLTAQVVIRKMQQEPQRVVPAQVLRGGGRFLVDDMRPGGKQEGEQETVGATLKTDPDLEQWLELADRYQQDGNYQAACRFWQAVLERSGDALFSDDEQTYFSLVHRVENILAGLPPAGLQAYRVKADASAKEILAAAGGEFDSQALSQVVRQYFLSSLGDESALTLSTMAMDRHDFVGAYRLLRKIVESYPDPTVSLHEVYLKMALCEAFLGDVQGANQSLANAESAEGEVDRRRLELVKSSIGKLTRAMPGTTSSAPGLPLGSTRRYGVMPALPAGALADEMQPVWQFYFDPVESYNWADFKDVTVLDGRDALGAAAAGTVTSTEKELNKSWRSKGWRPTGQLVFDDDRVYFKTAVDLISWDARNLSEDFSWRPVWRNAFEIDDYSKLVIMFRRNWNRAGRLRQQGGSDAPFSTREIQLFGDRVAAQMSVLDGVLYTIEGEPFDDRLQNLPSRQQSHWNTSARRSRSNYLTAYDAKSGVVLWSLPNREQEAAPGANDEGQVPDPDEELIESPYLQSGGFMGAPVNYRNLVIAPVNQGGAISVYAFDANQKGKTVWKSFLCDEPETGAAPWSPINLSVDGSDLFVSCGLGVVFVLDPSTGMIRFAKRYDRQGIENKLLRQYGRNMNQLSFEGWSSDTVIPYGQQMICFSSDTKTIESFNRNTGQLIWRSEMNPLGSSVDYLLGVHNDILYAAGRETVIGYDLQGEGRMVLGGEPLFGGEKSFGRGMLTADGIYLPVGNKIVQIGLTSSTERPQIIQESQVDLGTGAPLGNLYSDGEKIWVHGANRLYVLGKAEVPEVDGSVGSGESQ
ncbi:MAG: PQQ-binding-like beta-propeller repeat protein [Mariniblastus sp.]|nr:PQQ-binding-like beta-propeller repeat protein [Mariniblastus sp.]